MTFTADALIELLRTYARMKTGQRLEMERMISSLELARLAQAPTEIP